MSDSDEDESEEEKIDLSFKPREVIALPAREDIEEVKEEPATGANAGTVSKIKKPSLRMQRRQYGRRAKKLAASPSISDNDYIRYLDVKSFLSPAFVTAFQIVTITVYGMYALLAFLIMLFFILDYKMAMFDYTFIADSYTIMIIFLSFTLFLSIVGCYSTYLIGLSRDKTEQLLSINQNLHLNKRQCDEVSKFMRDDGKNFMIENDKFVDGQTAVKFEVAKTLHKLHKFGNSLRQYEKKFKNEEIKKIIHWTQMIYQDIYMENIRMRSCQDRSKIIKLFYEKQFNDGTSGLSKNEFNEMKEHLDMESTDQVHERILFRFPEFHEFDIDGDERVDMIEFEDKLNETYQAILDEITKKYNSNKTPKELEYEKEFYNVDNKESGSLLASFKKFMNPKKKRKA